MSAPGRGVYAVEGVIHAQRAEFERVRHWIEAALVYTGGTHSADDVLANIISGQLQLWTSPDCCAVTEVEHYPRLKNCHIFLAGGSLEALEKILGDIEAWAIKNGCAAVTMTGRRGWARSFLQGRGYRECAVQLARDLRGEYGQGQ